MHAHFDTLGTDTRAFDGVALNARSHGEGFLVWASSAPPGVGRHGLTPTDPPSRLTGTMYW
jgi:hypothetical protein